MCISVHVRVYVSLYVKNKLKKGKLKSFFRFFYFLLPTIFPVQADICLYAFTYVCACVCVSFRVSVLFFITERCIKSAMQPILQYNANTYLHLIVCVCVCMRVCV